MNKLILIILSVALSIRIEASTVTTREHGFEIPNSEVHTIESRGLNRKYDLYIKLPNDYFDEKNRLKKYPVLYLNDGPHTFKVAAGVTHFPSMDRAIIVGISFAHGEDGQHSRVRDLTPVVDKTWKDYATGGAPAYLKFIEHEVFPFIEEKYRVDVKNRILSGHSLGGSFGAWVLVTRPNLFSGYILTSPSLWFKDNLIFDLEEEYSKANTSLDAKIFMATGALETPENGMRNDMVAGHMRFIKRLQSRNYRQIRLRDEVVEGTDHYSTFPVGLAKGLRYMFRDM